MTKRIAHIHLGGGAHAASLFPGAENGQDDITQIHPSAPNLKALVDRGLVHAIMCTGPENPTASHFEMSRIIQDRGNFITGETGEGWGDYALAATFPGLPLAGVTVHNNVLMRVLQGGRSSCIALAANMIITEGFNIDAMIQAATVADDLDEYWRDIYVTNMGAAAEAGAIDLNFAALGQSMAEVLAENPDIKMVTGEVVGFDTHNNHNQQFAGAIGRFDASLGELARSCGWLDMPDGDMALPYPLLDPEDEVLLIVTTEFSRDYIWTSGDGLSHGRGGFTMIIGRGVKPGFTGSLPSPSYQVERMLGNGRTLPIDYPTERVILGFLQAADWQTEGLFTKDYAPLEGMFLTDGEPVPVPEPLEPVPEPEPAKTDHDLLVGIDARLSALDAWLRRP
ncbi:DUF1501 domain-containing protein [Hoeflea sp.]|uniref:DUF1501 domain-containing protein n=1 Tax=Hoeflea sp. TaxID=1940281 RepID=UPI00199373B6|nr:DUF1501 domain-containing protein [Hoeflea sp.]MBC7284489.1 DUF1501 domain-containing protein [Hoeflea sp.]